MSSPEALEIRGVRVRKGDDNTRLLGLMIEKAKECGQMPWETGEAGKHTFPAAWRRNLASTLTIPMSQLRAPQ